MVVQNMFSLVLGGWAKWLFIILAFFFLFSTLLSELQHLQNYFGLLNIDGAG